MSATPIDGFRKNLEKTLPELAKECREKLAGLETSLLEQREALSYIERLASAAGIDVGEKKKTEIDKPPPSLAVA